MMLNGEEIDMTEEEDKTIPYTLTQFGEDSISGDKS